MNVMLLDFFHVNGLECSETYLQSYCGNFNPTIFQFLENRGREMQSCGGSGDCSRMVRENGLVALAVGGIVLARNVRRKRNMAEPFDGLVHVSLGDQANPAQPVLTATYHLGGELSFSEIDTLSYTYLAA